MKERDIVNLQTQLEIAKNALEDITQIKLGEDAIVGARKAQIALTQIARLKQSEGSREDNETILREALNSIKVKTGIYSEIGSIAKIALDKTNDKEK